MQKKQLFGLVGRDIGHSFSKKYFTDKFELQGLDDHEYVNFDLADISLFPDTIAAHPNLKGLNVTIPYKETVIPYLSALSKKAAQIGAVNTIRFLKNGQTKGYNTDWYGFKKSIRPMLEPHHKNALILGTGGAAKAIAFALEEMDIRYTFVSRSGDANHIGYGRLNSTTFDNFQIIVNCTPQGSWPKIDEMPNIPYEFFTNKHIAFDLVYNPAETKFLQLAKARGAQVKNGYEMLVNQAEKAWKIWHR